MLKKIISISLSILLCANIYAQNAEILNQKFGFKNYCFDNKIHTIKAYKTGNELSEPLIEFGKGETVTFSFDDLSEKSRNLSYTITHCNADWLEDNLFIGDYMKGFEENNLYDFSTSINTFVEYKNYTFTLPNNDIEILASGNYLLKVFDTHDTSKPLFQQCFRVLERRASLNLEYRNLVNTALKGKQQLEFSVNTANIALQNPSAELKIKIEQNSHPVLNADFPTISFQNNLQISYSGANKNIYDGGNEFRVFDIRNLGYNAQGVNKIENIENEYQVLLNVDEARSEKPYVYVRDINGDFTTDASLINNSGNKNTEADYVSVYFTVAANDDLKDVDLYVFGALSNWSLRPNLKMEYNAARNDYEATVLLKQGYYNYMYLAVDKNGNCLPCAFDGCFSETENNYTVYVYYRGFGDRWDKLIAAESINTINN